MTVCPADTQDEIEKIMSEIENLQQVMNETEGGDEAAVEEASPVEAAAPATEADTAAEEPMAEFRASEGDVPMEETLSELHEEGPAPSGGMLSSIGQPEAAAPVVTEPDPVTEESPVHLAYRAAASPEAQAQQGGALSLRLTGSMTLTLEYEYEGEQVSIGFTDNMLRVQLTDGTEFKIPVRRENKLRRVA